MRLRYLAPALGLVLLATFAVRAQNGQNGQNGYWTPSGPTQEKLYINSGEADINNLTIVDVATMKVIKKMTTRSRTSDVATPLYLLSRSVSTVDSRGRVPQPL